MSHLHACHRASLSEPVHAGVSIPIAPRKVYDTRDDDRTAGLHGDCDDDKYRRRPALGWLAQLLRYMETCRISVRKERTRDGQFDDSRLVLGTGSIQGQGHNEVLTGRQAYHACLFQGLCPFLLQEV